VRAFFEIDQGKDPRRSTDAAWELLEQMRDPHFGAGIDEEFLGGGGTNFDEKRFNPFTESRRRRSP